MYEAPVTIYETAMQTIMEKREGAIFAKIQSAFDVDVDKAELIRALQYDRDQYNKGYADGKRDAEAALVRCKDCKHYNASANSCFNRQWDMETATEVPFVCASDFCSYGERRNDEA